MQINDQGQIAVAYYQPIPHIVGVGKTEYSFVVKRSVSMAWINPKDIDKIFSIRKNCSCSGGSNPVYRYASDSQVRVWTGVAER